MLIQCAFTMSTVSFFFHFLKSCHHLVIDESHSLAHPEWLPSQYKGLFSICKELVWNIRFIHKKISFKHFLMSIKHWENNLENNWYLEIQKLNEKRMIKKKKKVPLENLGKFTFTHYLWGISFTLKNSTSMIVHKYNLGC